MASSDPDPDPDRAGDPPRGAPPLGRSAGLFRGRVLSLGRIGGVRVGADSTWFVVLALVAGLVAANLYAVKPEWGSGVCFLLGLVASFAFFASILLHELGHVLMATTLGLPVVSVTLYVFGGISQHASEPRRPRDAMLIALAGPLVSFVLFLVCVIVRLMLPTSGAWSEAASHVVGHVMTINFLVLAINLLPGLPLDGGFALRALMWAFTGSAERGTRVASAAGGLIALFLVALGIAVLVGLRRPDGLWLVLFGWLLMRAARNSALHLVLRSVLGRVRVRDAMVARVDADRWNTVADLQELMRETRGPVFVSEDAHLLGWLTPSQVLAIPARKRAFVQVSNALVPLAAIVRIAAGRTLLDALELMNSRGARELAVSEDGEIVGAVTREGVFELLREKGGPGFAGA